MRYVAAFLSAAFFVTVALAGCGGEDLLGDVCESYCVKEAECYPPEEQSANCTQSCSCILDAAADASAECGAAAAGVYACAAALPSCGEVLAMLFQVPADSYPCKAAFDNFYVSIDDPICAEAVSVCVGR